MNLAQWAGCSLLVVAGCDSGGSEGATDDPGGGASTSSETSGVGASGGVSTSTSSPTGESSGSTGGEATDSATSTGASPIDPPRPCGGWRTDLRAGFEGALVLGLPDGQIAVSGALDDSARIEFFDSGGAPLWFFEHDASGGDDEATVIRDLVAVGEERVLGIATVSRSSPGFVFLLDLGTQAVIWNRYVDEDFVDYELGPTSYFIGRSPLRVAATSEGELALVSRGEDWEQIHLTMGLDPLTGSRTWMNVAYAQWSSVSGFVANDAAGWFTQVSSFSSLGAAGYVTHRWVSNTGEAVASPRGPAGSGSPGETSGAIAIRGDGALVVPLTESTPVAETLHILTRFPDGTSGATVDVQTKSYPSVRATAVDVADRVYMLVGGAGSSSGPQSLIRFDPEVSVETVLIADEHVALWDIATTRDDEVILLGDDGIGFIEQACME